MKPSTLVLGLAFATLMLGCEEEKPPVATKPSAAPVAAPPPPPPVASTPPAPPKLRDDCPKGSSGVGTSAEPCLASGTSRMMEVAYTGKTTDQGPKFSIVNKADQQILFGSLAVYFYDKAGKQLQTAGDKPKPMQVCSGNIFAGAVKPGEKIFMFFSCVKKEHVPEGTATIEAEVKTVGFADEEGKKNEFYWSNPDLVPNERPKGGLKAAATKKK
jgi:hypothetical protein